MLNHEQSLQLKKNLIRDVKDSKSTHVALVSESFPSTTTSFVVITELDDPNSEDLSDADFDESLALLTNTFRRFARKSNFQKKKPLAITDKPRSTPVDKASAICYNCQGKGHFANDCSYKKNRFSSPTPASSSSKNDKYQKLKEKYRKIKSQRRGKGLVAEDHDWADSSDSSDDEEDTINLGLMALNDEVDLGLMAKIEDIPEEVAESSSSSASTSATQVPISSNAPDSLSALDSLTVDLYNALNGKTKAESMNTDLRDQLSSCHQRIKELTIFEENLRDQVIVNQLLCIER
jgi:hypothetical protein